MFWDEFLCLDYVTLTLTTDRRDESGYFHGDKVIKDMMKYYVHFLSSHILILFILCVNCVFLERIYRHCSHLVSRPCLRPRLRVSLTSGTKTWKRWRPLFWKAGISSVFQIKSWASSTAVIVTYSSVDTYCL